MKDLPGSIGNINETNTSGPRFNIPSKSLGDFSYLNMNEKCSQKLTQQTKLDRDFLRVPRGVSKTPQPGDARVDSGQASVIRRGRC
jgi:hypothetical protein